MAAVELPRPEINRFFQQAIASAIRDHGEVGLQVAVYHENTLVVDAWGGIADETTDRPVDGETLFPVFSVVKAVGRVMRKRNTSDRSDTRQDQ